MTFLYVHKIDVFLMPQAEGPPMLLTAGAEWDGNVGAGSAATRPGPDNGGFIPPEAIEGVLDLASREWLFVRHTDCWVRWYGLGLVNYPERAPGVSLPARFIQGSRAGMPPGHIFDEHVEEWYKDGLED